MKKGITVVFILLVIIFGYITVKALTAPVKLSAAQLGSELIHSHKTGIDCFACHTIDGKGGNVGPNLSKEGLLKHSVKWIEVQIATPGNILNQVQWLKLMAKLIWQLCLTIKCLTKKNYLNLHHILIL